MIRSNPDCSPAAFISAALGKPMPDKSRTLVDTDISSQRMMSRRSLLHTLGLGAGAAAAAALGASAQAQTKRRDPCRDGDQGIPSDQDGCGRPPTS
jgi:hypothetical protein